MAVVDDGEAATATVVGAHFAGIPIPARLTIDVEAVEKPPGG
jgi:hypothetical protein